MMTKDASSVVLQLKFERGALEPLNRTVAHCLHLASGRDVLAGFPKGQHCRRVPSTWGVRRDVFSWDSWDWKLRGEDDLRRFFEIAQRIGDHFQNLDGTEAADLLPGTVPEVIGRRTDLFLPDYWLLVVHYLGWTDQLPYECETHWSRGESFSDDSFHFTSRLPVNIVQASIDALTVFIDAVPHDACDRNVVGDVRREFTFATWDVDLAEDVKTSASPPRAARSSGGQASPDKESTEVFSGGQATAVALPRPKRVRKRADRATNIEALKQDLVEHLQAARDHAQAAVDFGREPELLPRPSRRELAERVGISESAASRCFSDPAARELKVLWETADDLDAVLRFVRHR